MRPQATSLRAALIEVFEPLAAEDGRDAGDGEQGLGGESLTRLTSGLDANDLVVLSGAADTLVTGTALLWTVGLAGMGRKAYVFTLGRPAKHYASLLLSRLSGVPTDRVRLRHLSPEDHGSLVDASSDDLADREVAFDEATGPLVEEIRSRVGQVHVSEEGPLDLIVVDGLELLALPGDRRYLSPQAGSCAVVRDLKRLARELHCPILALLHLEHCSPLSRRCLDAAVRESADVCLAVDDPGTSPPLLTISKNARGPTGVVGIRADGRVGKLLRPLPIEHAAAKPSAGGRRD